MSEAVVFDTSVLIDQIRTNRSLDRILCLSGPVRHSSVVLAELWRGASSAMDRRIVRALENQKPILAPTESHWMESGRLLAEMRAREGFEPPKLRSLHFDVLIALSVRAYGARLITSNRADFEMIRKYRDFKLEVW